MTDSHDGVGEAGWTLHIDAGDTMHSFSVSFEIRAVGSMKTSPPSSSSSSSGGVGLPLAEIAAGAERRRVVINRNTGFLQYVEFVGNDGGQAPLPNILRGGSRDLLDGEWHMITVTHHWARKETVIYVDGSLLSVPGGGDPGYVERLAPTNISLITTSLAKYS